MKLIKTVQIKTAAAAAIVHFDLNLHVLDNFNLHHPSRVSEPTEAIIPEYADKSVTIHSETENPYSAPM